ncbi:hypothetical protein HZY83_03210 [Gemella sp. GH3]|uniref:hypothetical protein n=1 Tax=unclassified Gemella TaxID=2624949 RepID=UPI0015D06AB6|nr:MULTISPECIES: hypothetical protein [unclassified Gemella]MBF0713689.1 hypothetical protein [Gemella sp. GH3.1]NYS50641.1 hypothetical protein [Gemella sp. GH3]
MSEKVSDFELQLRNIILSKSFFFKEPQKDRIIIYSILYILFIMLGSFFNLLLLSVVIVTPMLTYVLGAKGLKVFVPLSIVGTIVSLLISDFYGAFWVVLHVFISLMIYLSLINRLSKLTIVIYTSSFLFVLITIFGFMLIKLGYINFNPDAIKNFIYSYVDNVASLQPEVDKDLLLHSFESINLYLSSLVAISLAIYSFLLVHYTLKFLGKSRVIIPVFPRLGTLVTTRKISLMYILLLFLSVVTSIYFTGNEYTMLVILLSNLIAVTRWIFVFNGANTIAFFVGITGKKLTPIFKLLLFVAMYIFNPMFEIIGLIDGLFSLRERYIKMQGGK